MSFRALVPPHPPLAFPPAALRLRAGAGRAEVYDALRYRWLKLTPEEWVRQHLVRFLIDHRGVPAGLVALERTFPYNGLPRRADLVAYRRDGRAWLLAECKAPAVSLTQATFAQAARYNRSVGAALVVVTNGRAHHVYRIAPDGAFAFLPDVPRFEDA